ncbi:hypothetical protein ESCO_002511 [Escovopsis weberi]|uniref:Methyltransferase domain-containing protein n=1 Tax=Escovopsis weberi TaxID=150374 RepID=A0A0M8MSR8_ESCWE|nr:hypothetical protein ESCO_002511 [Escovopsis weberi]
MATALADDYVLGRDLLGSIRLDAQHAIWTIHNGWTMNPRIPITRDMKIAEIGTGTSLWLLDLAAKLPETVTLDGFDISDSQFPPSSLLPPNVTLRTMNALDTVPEELVGTPEPGGYIQWEDGDVGLTNTHGKDAETLLSIMHKACDGNGIQFG